MAGGPQPGTDTRSVKKDDRSVLLVADQDPIRERRWRSAGVRLTSCDREGQRLHQLIVRTRPNWLILGEALQDKQITSAMVDVRRSGQGTKVALLGTKDDFSRCERWVRFGVTCYLASSSTDARIMQALSVSDEQSIVIVDACFQERLTELVRSLEPRPILSQRELQLLMLVAAGLRTEEIAADVHLTGHTVEFHFRNIISKLGARNRTQAVARAIILGLITSAECLAGNTLS